VASNNDTVNVPEGLRKDLDTISKLLRGANGSALWDVLTAMRGPDFPSERPNMSPREASAAYRGRRERKYRTGEVLRAVALPGACIGARTHFDTKVVLPPTDQWDHYDKHVARAARALGLGVEIIPDNIPSGAVKVEFTSEGKILEDKVKELLGEHYSSMVIEFINKADTQETSSIKIKPPNFDPQWRKTLRAKLNNLGIAVQFVVTEDDIQP